VKRALQFWGYPTLTDRTTSLVLAFAKAQLKRGNAPAIVETALRRLIITSPDLQTV
jgi:hypothetical protein